MVFLHHWYILEHLKNELAPIKWYFHISTDFENKEFYWIWISFKIYKKNLSNLQLLLAMPQPIHTHLLCLYYIYIYIEKLITLYMNNNKSSWISNFGMSRAFPMLPVSNYRIDQNLSNHIWKNKTKVVSWIWRIKFYFFCHTRCRTHFVTMIDCCTRLNGKS